MPVRTKPAAEAAQKSAKSPKSGKGTGSRRRQTGKQSAAPASGEGRDFPVVGIGCSAGGLDALLKFFHNVPADSGAAFIVVQHLDPAHASTLPELIQRVTRLTVREAGGRMRVKPGAVYVIPPNKELSIQRGMLQLHDPAGVGERRLAVDFLLRSLAEDWGEQAIGIILSGMGSDGVLGLRAIKAKGGLTLVQDPTDAKAGSMPRSAIEAGLADIVGRADELPARMAAYLRYPVPIVKAEGSLSPEDQAALEKIVTLLFNRSGDDFSQYKTNSLYRRIERRTALHQQSGLAEYLDYLTHQPQELDLLLKELLIGVTSFFRDPAAWDFLRDSCIPALLAKHPAGQVLRAWVPACSSGEEAYSLAIVFRESLEHVMPEKRFSLQIYATDLDADAIDKARKGFYPDNIAADVSPERLVRYFAAEEGGYRIGKSIRDMVVFAKQNIIIDPPFTSLDILCCRNLRIYFNAALQKRLLTLFHYALNRDGVLMLGTAESVGEQKGPERDCIAQTCGKTGGVPARRCGFV